MMLHTKYHGSRPYGFRQEDLFMFFFTSLCKTCDLWGELMLHKNLVKVHELMLHTKYQWSRPCGFRRDDVLMFSHISLC